MVYGIRKRLNYLLKIIFLSEIIKCYNKVICNINVIINLVSSVFDLFCVKI